MKLLCILMMLFVILLVGCQPIQPVASAAQPWIGPSTDAEKIANAISAAPMSIAKDAAVKDWPVNKDTPAKDLRAGTNGWLCRPDDPASPLNDPRCYDPNWQKLFGKPYDERDPEATFGVSYMLQGGSEAANDVFMTMPMTGTGWQVDPPHLMIVLPVPWDQTVFTNKLDNGGDWVMYKDSPLEHLMVPIFTVHKVEKGDDKIANALSAGPLSITGEAAVWDYPATAGGEWQELRAGTNGWTCVPDNPANPANDPMCLDAAWLQWFEDVVAGKAPHATSYGIAYMLQGGSVADNDDPTLTEPAAGKDWQVDPSHIMILSPDSIDPTAYSKDMHGMGPWIMFGGTPAEHLMFPVEDAPAMAMK